MARTTVNIDAALAARVASRAARGMRPDNLAAAAANELALLDSLLGLELRRIRLTLAEARALADVLAGSVFEPYALGLLLYAEASDAFELARGDDPTGGQVSSYATRHGIDERALLAKLLVGGPAADLALRDALSRWWESDDHPGDEVSFRAVGMTIIDIPDREAAAT